MMRPPKRGARSIPGGYLKQEHEGRLAQRIRTMAPLAHKEGPGGTTIYWGGGPIIVPARSVGTIPAGIEHDGGASIEPGHGKVQLYNRNDNGRWVLDGIEHDVQNPIPDEWPSGIYGYVERWGDILIVLGWLC